MNTSEIIKALDKKRYTLRRWAKEHEYKYSTVKSTLDRHAESKEAPRGKIAQDIMADLEITLGKPVQPKPESDA